MSLHLQVRLFGDFHLAYDGAPITTVTSAPGRSLLAYLLLHRDSPQSRLHLAYLFWPDSTEAQARTNLRRELHYLRRALPDAGVFLSVDAKTLQWRPDTRTTLDVADFENMVAQVNQAEQAGDRSAQQAALEKAVALYHGDLLPSNYDDWVLSERERLSQVFIGLLERLIQILEQQRDYAPAIRYAQRLQRYDPLHEATYRHLMRLYALSGDRAQGLRVYHTCVTTLKRELDVDPSPATREVYERLIEVDRSPPAPAAAAALAADGRLVGRQAEWERLQAAWRRTAAGSRPGAPHLVSITGDAGIGKTRLLEELLIWAGRQGIAAARTRCYAAAGLLAYGPVADWLRAEVLQAALPALDDVWLTEVARLLPELLVERPHLPRPAPLSESGQRLRLFNALAQVVLVDRGPLLLAIDDLQWCDRETLEWLHHLLRSAPQRRLLVAGAVRAEDLVTDHPLRALMLDLSATDQVTEVELGPLSAEGTAVLTAQVIGHDLDPDLIRRLYAETEGNPLFVVEMARAQVADDGRWRSSPRTHDLGTALDLSSATLPPKVHAVIQSRLAQLSPHARELADVAATVGRSFTYQVLALAAATTEEEALVRGLDELWRRRLIREQGIDGYDFSHDKIREVTYGSISRAHRRLLHRRVAQALEIVYAAGLDPVSGQIAAHYEQAGLASQAITYYRRAAEVARQVYANQEAKTLYSHALEVSRQIPLPSDDARLLPVYEGRALVYRSLTQLEQAIVDFHAMRRAARAAGDRRKEGESLCHLAYTHWLTFAEDQMPFVEQYAREAMELLASHDDAAIRARSLTMLGAVDQVQRRLDGAGRKLEEALTISQDTQDGEALVQALSFLCLQTYLQGNVEATVQYAQEGVAAARAVQDDFNELRIASFLCQSQWSAGAYARALTLLHETMAQAQARGNTFVQGRLLNTLGWFHHELGDFVRAATYNQESANLGHAFGVAHVEISALVNLGYDYLALGEPARALTYFEPTLERVEREGVGAHKWRWRMKLHLGLAEHAYATAALEQALRYADSGLAEAQAASSRKYVVKGWALRGKILQRLGQYEAAGAELARACSLAEELHHPSLVYPVTYALGRWYEMQGQADAAAELVGKAKNLIAQMADAIGDERLAAGFLQSEQVRAITES